MSLQPTAVTYRRTDDRLVVSHEERRLFSETPPVYVGASRLLNWNDNGKTGVWLKLRLLEVDDAVRHPFKGLRWAHKAADGHRLRITLGLLSGDGAASHLYGGEVTLGTYGDDCVNGVVVKLWLDAAAFTGEDRECMRAMKDLAPGDAELAFCCWAIGDDERPEAPTHVRPGGPRVPFAAKDATVQAGIKCSDPEFQEWCAVVGARHLLPEEVAALPRYEDEPRRLAEDVVRGMCKIASRRMLKEASAQGEAARKRWIRILRNFGEWRIHRAAGLDERAA